HPWLAIGGGVTSTMHGMRFFKILFFNLETCSAPIGSVSQQPFTSMDQELGFSAFNQVHMLE
ncbi:hypothetical protein AKJ16_DCAP11538, partial [Drosera capensis]